MARLLALGLALFALAVSASAWPQTALPVGACGPDQCAKFDLTKLQKIAQGTFDSSKNSSWSARYYRDVGFYLGQYNKRYKKSQMTEADQPSVNYQCYAEEPDFVFKTFTVARASDCCDACRGETDCTIYQIIPDFDVDGMFSGGGVCQLRKGGSSSIESDAFPPKNVTLTAPAVVGCSSSVTATWVGGRCNPYVTDDPHFMGAHGTKFDFNGQPGSSYCLTTDSRIQINAAIKGYKEAQGEHAVRSWIKEVGILWVDAAGAPHKAHLKARTGADTARGNGYLASVSVDGLALAVPSLAGTPESAVSKGDFALAFLGTSHKKHFDVDRFALSVNGLLTMSFNMRVAHEKLRKRDDAEVHFNLIFDHIEVTDKVHGVLGQTYRNTPEQRAKAIKYTELSKLLHGRVAADGETGKGFLEGQPQDYITSSILSSNCKFSAFGESLSQ